MSKSIEHYPVAVGSTLRIADGNPSYLYAMDNLYRREGQDFYPIFLEQAALPAQTFHRMMTLVKRLQDSYTSNSENLRASWAAKFFGMICFYEFCAKLQLLPIDHRHIKQWHLTQEHPLFGASSTFLNYFNIQRINVMVPDVFPKESAKQAVEKHLNAQLVVWNDQAFQELERENIPAILAAPFLLDGFASRFQHRAGISIMMKSSGSGMSPEWIHTLQSFAQQTNQSFEIHLPSEYINNTGKYRAHRKQYHRLQRFYDGLGENTRFLIAPPNELVQVVATMRARGNAIQMLLLPCRGKHEIRNMEYAVATGCALGILQMSPDQKHSWGNIPLILPSEAEHIVRDAQNTVKPSLDIVLGRESIFEALTIQS